MDEEAIIPYLREKYPGAFEGWDEFETKITMRDRKGRQPEMLVALYNDGSEKGLVVDLHNVFMILLDDDGGETIRIGKELYAEWNDIYIPDQYREENLT